MAQTSTTSVRLSRRSGAAVGAVRSLWASCRPGYRTGTIFAITSIFRPFLARNLVRKFPCINRTTSLLCWKNAISADPRPPSSYPAAASVSSARLYDRYSFSISASHFTSIFFLLRAPWRKGPCAGSQDARHCTRVSHPARGAT